MEGCLFLLFGKMQAKIWDENERLVSLLRTCLRLTAFFALSRMMGTVNLPPMGLRERVLQSRLSS